MDESLKLELNSLLVMRCPGELIKALDSIADQQLLTRSAVARQILARELGVLPTTPIKDHETQTLGG